jgi:hypothetical protein
MRRILDEYEAAGNPWPPIAKEVAKWAVATNRYDVDAKAKVTACAKDLAEAFGSDHFIDGSGRKVRRMAVAPRVVIDDDGKKITRYEWDHVHSATPEHMLQSFRMRYKQCKGDVRQLKNDIEFYNENCLRDGYEQICFDFDFNEIAEPA